MPTKPSPTPQLDALLAVQPDLVDRIFEYLIAAHPEIATLKLDSTRQAVRAEFHGERARIGPRSTSERRRLMQDVLALFNGRNAAEIARRLGLSRATVYRWLKQAGYDRAERSDLANSLKLAPNETTRAVRSAPTPAKPHRA